MKVMVTGANGQLGYDVINELNERGHEVTGVDVDDMDVVDEEAVRRVIIGAQPDAVIHCAAYTAVDAAEDNRERCLEVNVKGTGNIVNACREADAKLVFISTDYVFDGTKKEPWVETDEGNPLSVYGDSKFQAERLVRQGMEKHFIVRVSWLFGENGNNFVKTMLKIGAKGISPNVVADQTGSPTYTRDLCVLLADMVVTERYGVYHATNEGYCSWYDFAKAIYDLAGMEVDVSPVDTSQYPAKARRPLNSRLSKDKLEKAGFQRLPHWKDALGRFLAL